MSIRLRRLLLVYEPPDACRRRMIARGLDREAAAEVAFYLAQSTDFAALEPEVRLALAGAGIELMTCPIDDRARWLSMLGDDLAASTLVWSLTDGFDYYRGSFVSSVAALHDVAQFGSPPAAQHACQDKFRCLALAASLGVAVPATVLVENGEPLSPLDVLPEGATLFVKPNTLGAKLGISSDSRIADRQGALDLTRRIWRRYRDRALVQCYLPGRDVRVSFMDLGDDVARIGSYAVKTGERGFATLEDSFRVTRMRTADGRDLSVAPVDCPKLIAAAGRIAKGAGLRDYWSMDFRLDEDGTPYFLELEVCPAITIYDFLTYLRELHGCGLAEAIVRAPSAAFARRQEASR